MQLNLLLSALLAIAAASAYVTGSCLVGISTMLLGLAFGEQFIYSFYALSEAPFTAAFGIAIAAALAYLRSKALWLAITVGCALGIAFSIKASAPALIVPAAFLLLLPTRRRLIAATALVGIPALCLVALILFGRISHGSWSPTNFMGVSLIGHVAYGIRDDGLASNPELSAAINNRIRKYYEKWPPISDLDAYMIASQNDYNPMLWSEVVPLVVKTLSLQGARRGSCSKEANAAFITLAKEAIERFPAWFIGHAAAHYYGLWSFAAMPFPLQSIAASQRVNAIDNEKMGSWWVPKAWHLGPFRDALHNAADRAALLPLYFEAFQRKLSDTLSGAPLWVIGILATAMAPCAIFLNRLPRNIAAIAIIAAFIVPYFAAHSLFQVALTRYTAPAQFGIAAFIVLVIFAVISWLSRLLGRKLGRPKGDQSRDR